MINHYAIRRAKTIIDMYKELSPEYATEDKNVVVGDMLADLQYLLCDRFQYNWKDVESVQIVAYNAIKGQE